MQNRTKYSIAVLKLSERCVAIKSSFPKQRCNEKLNQPISVSPQNKALPEEVKHLVEKGVVHKIFAEHTKEEGVGRFVVELINQLDDEFSLYEVFHFAEKNFLTIKN